MPSIGDEFGGYRIDGLLGRGGMGTVYAATDLALKREVAIKVISRQPSSDASFSERFRREAAIQANLDHPHIVPVHAFGEVEGELYLVMRMIRGDALSTLLDEGRVSQRKSLDFLAQVADALDSAHEVNLVHRDVKPDNILISDRDIAFLADFGLTRDIADDARLTKSGAFVGTVNYVSPEQVAGRPPTGAADVYSLTAVLFECMTGQVPYVRDSEVAVLYAHMRDPIPSACALNPALPLAMDAVMLAGLAKDAIDRPASAVELIEMAKSTLAPTRRATTRDRPQVATTVISEAIPESPPPDPPHPEVRRRRITLAIALAGASLAGGAVLGKVAEHPVTPTTMTARSSAVSLTYSGGWTAASSAATTPGLALKHTVALRHRDGLSLVAGVAATHAATLLPSTLTRRLPGAVMTDDRVKLADAEGVRYGSLVVNGSTTHMRLVAVPTKDNVAYVVCTRSAALSERDQQACETVVSTLEITGKALALAPRADYANAITKAMSPLRSARAALFGKLKEAGRPVTQATALKAFAPKCRSSASGMRAAPAGPQEAGSQTAIEAAADRVCDAYRTLAHAAGDNDRAAYNRARTRAARADSALRARVRALDALGYHIS